MDKNVEILLNAEAEVNAKVNKALQEKDALLQTIRREAEINLKAYKEQKAHQYEKSLAEVCIFRFNSPPLDRREIEEFRKQHFRRCEHRDHRGIVRRK